mmetsp:Transcript_14684/g.39140  ORF Transcript_14684/g.39140 Transcript_14684/m.39140 type:complete len:202 (+) Transcript_14684:222-827(+)
MMALAARVGGLLGPLSPSGSIHSGCSSHSASCACFHSLSAWIHFLASSVIRSPRPGMYPKQSTPSALPFHGPPASPPCTKSASRWMKPSWPSVSRSRIHPPGHTLRTIACATCSSLSVSFLTPCSSASSPHCRSNSPSAPIVSLYIQRSRFGNVSAASTSSTGTSSTSYSSCFASCLRSESSGVTRFARGTHTAGQSAPPT